MCFVSPTSTLKLSKKEILQKIEKQSKNETYESLKFMRNLSKKFEIQGLENPSFIRVIMDKNETSQYGQVILYLLHFRIPSKKSHQTYNE
jgi:hypothetical protein